MISWRGSWAVQLQLGLIKADNLHRVRLYQGLPRHNILAHLEKHLLTLRVYQHLGYLSSLALLGSGSLGLVLIFLSHCTFRSLVFHVEILSVLVCSLLTCWLLRFLGTLFLSSISFRSCWLHRLGSACSKVRAGGFDIDLVGYWGFLGWSWN